MRWDNLQIGAEEQASLPGYRDPAIVRRFDAPEALDTRFYEVRAKSALNTVPEMSRMPFRWTINPYRGCTHACTYCGDGDMPVLMANGRTKPLRDLRRGDAIYGTERRGTYRHYVPTQVLDHWQTLKPAYRTTLEDGTQLLTSGDHRFLTARGWKYVTGPHMRPQRPHLTVGTKLLGVGAFARPPAHCPEYQRGYLTGMVRGDGHLGSYEYPASEKRGVQRVNVFRLALVDLEGLQRTRDFLGDVGVATGERRFSAATAVHREVRAIGTAARANVTRIQELVEWPRSATNEWCKGFLAGIFDAEGHHGGAIRVSNKDAAIIDWTAWCLGRLAFDFTVEAPRTNGCRNVRLLGGLKEKLRFFHTTDPAITRKRTIDGIALKSDARLRVESIEPLGVEPVLYDITTGTGDFVFDGLISHNCFARPTHTYLGFNAGRDFEREIVVKVNTPELVRAELGRRSWKGEHVALGTNTDPYQWVESKYELLPGVWEAMRDHRNPCSVLSKSPLMLRDVGLFKEIAEVTEFSAMLSIPTLNEKAWRASEPHTPHPRKRMEAVAELNRQGIPCGILIAPLMPGINDAPGQVEKILELAAEAGAVSVGGVALHLRGEVRQVFMDWLESYRPDLVPRYRELYRRGAYAPPEVRERLAKRARLPGLMQRRFLRGARDGPEDEPWGKPARSATEKDHARAGQTSLF